MPVITLPDGSQREFAQPVTVAEVAQSIGTGLARAALAGRVDDRLVDTSFRIESDARLGIITDNTIYTIIRVQIGSQLLKDENKLALLEYLNQLNRSYKVFKYVAAEDGSIFLDACLPSTNESFDAEIVRVILDVIVDHLNNEYKNIMKQAWK